MNRRFLVVLAVLLVGCAPVAPSILPSATSQASAPKSAGPTAAAAAEPCRPGQVSITPGQSGGVAAGTSYLTVYVELAQGPPCTIPWGPKVTIVGAGGRQVATSSETEAKPITLDYITRYYVGWAGDCGPTPTGALTARIEFSATVILDMPIGTFRPTYCPGENDEQILSMYADEREVGG